MATESPIEYWNNLASAADEGELFLDSIAARHCDSACSDYLEVLRTEKYNTNAIATIKGMGSFDSGIALARKFSLKAQGGPNNLADVLQSHIDVVMAMQAVFRKFFDATEVLDQDNAAQVGKNGPK